MAYVPDIRRPGYGAAWQTKKAYKQRDFHTKDGKEYTLYVPSSQQFKAYERSFNKHKDVFDQIKADVKDDPAIAKNRDGLPSNWDHYEWAANLSSTLKMLDKTWGVNDKIWIRNKMDDGSKSTVAVVAITPVKPKSNTKRTAKKPSAASGATEPAEAAAATSATDDSGYIDADDIVFGDMLPSITQVVFVKTINELTYYYYTREDAINNKYFKIENSDDELVNESGKRINPDGTLMKFIRKTDFDKRQERKRSKRKWAEKAIETRNDVWLDDYDTSPEPSEGFITDEEESDEEEMDEEVEDRDTALARMVKEDAAIAAEEARIAEEHARTADKHASIAKEHARIAEKARIEVEKDREEKERNLKLRTAIRRRAHLANAAGAEEPAGVAKQARIEEPARTTEAEPARIAELARIAADPRLVEASRDLPAGWRAFISKTYNTVYYHKPSPDGIGEGTRVWEKPTAGGNRTKKRLRRKSSSKQMKKKRTTTRRKMTTTRRK